VTALHINGSDIFAGTGRWLDTTLGAFVLGRVFVSADNGNSWTQLSDNGFTPAISEIFSLTTYGTDIFIFIGPGGGQEGVYVSTNNGNTWTMCDSLPFAVTALAVRDSSIFAACDYYGGLGVSPDYGNSWEGCNVDPAQAALAHAIAISGNMIFFFIS
jgi:hypothetical protein